MQAVMAISSFALLSLVIPPVSLFSTAGIALVALRKGAAEGVVVILGAGVAIALLGLLVTGNMLVVTGYGLLLWLPIFLIALVLRGSGQLTFAVEISVIVGLCVVGAVYLFLPDPASLWNERLQATIEAVLQSGMANENQSIIKDNIEKMSPFMTGLVAAGSIASLMFGLLLARWWQAKLFNPGGFRSEFLALRPRKSLAYAGLVFVLLASTAGAELGETAWNLVITLTILYLLVGVSVLHRIIAETKAKQLLLTVFYLVIVFIPHALLPVVLIGFSDAWVDWRNKFCNYSAHP